MQEHRYYVVATTPQSRRRNLEGSPSFPQIITARASHRDPPLLADLSAARSSRLSPWHAGTTTEQENAFWHPLAELRRLKLIFRRPTSKPLKRS
jgi:hypothetical protein